MSATFGLIQMLLIGYIAYIETNKKSPVVFLWATLMVMFGVPHFVTTVVRDTVYSDVVLFEASLFVVCFMI